MKKTYIIPNVSVIKLVTAKMLAASIDINSTGDNIDAGHAAARDGSFWDDDDE